MQCKTAKESTWCNAPRCFAGLASKYFVGKEGVLSHCFVEFGQIKAGSFRWFGSRSGGIAPELLTKVSELIEDSFALLLVDVGRWGWWGQWLWALS